MTSTFFALAMRASEVERWASRASNFANLISIVSEKQHSSVLHFLLFRSFPPKAEFVPFPFAPLSVVSTVACDQ